MGWTRRGAIVGGVASAATPALLSAGCAGRPVEPISVAALVAIDPDNRQSASAGRKLSLADYADQLGRGYDSVLGETRRPFVSGEIVETRIAPDERDRANKVSYHLTEDQQSYSFVRSMSASASGGFGTFRGGGSTSRTTSKQTSSYALHICAVARRFDRSLIMASRSLEPTAATKAQITRARNRRGWLPGSKDTMLRDFGDQFVLAVTSGSELFLDLAFECASRADKDALKASVSASYGGLASGRGSFSQVISSARSQKSVTMTISGIDGSGVPLTISAEEANRIIAGFLDNETLNAQAIYLTPRDVAEVEYRPASLDWVDFQQRTVRDRFFAEAAASLEYLANAQTDASYVARNVDEFDQSTLDRAAADLPLITARRARVEEAVQNAYDRYRNSGQTGDWFAIQPVSLSDLSLRKYDQKTPAPTPPAERPRPKPPQPRCQGRDCRPDVRF